MGGCGCNCVGGTTLIVAVMYVCVCWEGRERSWEDVCGCDCVGVDVILWVDVCVIVCVRKGVCVWDSLDYCRKVCVCFGERGRGSVCVGVTVWVWM